MKILLPKLVIISIALTPFLFAETKTIPAGWSLNGLGLSESELQTNSLPSEVNTVWRYTSSGWEAYSPDSTTASQISGAGIATLNSLKPGDGFWINANSSTTLKTTTTSGVSISESTALSSMQSQLDLANKTVMSIPKVTTSTVSAELNIKDDENKAYTFNYIVGGGVSLSEYIDWNSAESINKEDDYEEGSLSKAIAKVFNSSDGKYKLIVSSHGCDDDYTIAITPYQSTATMPGYAQNYWNNQIKTKFLETLPTTQEFPTFVKGSSTQTIHTPIRELSFDISLENSS